MVTDPNPQLIQLTLDSHSNRQSMMHQVNEIPLSAIQFTDKKSVPATSMKACRLKLDKATSPLTVLVLRPTSVRHACHLSFWKPPPTFHGPAIAFEVEKFETRSTSLRPRAFPSPMEPVETAGCP